MYIHTHITYMHAYIHVYACLYTWAHMCVCIYINTILQTYKGMCGYMHPSIHTCICIINNAGLLQFDSKQCLETNFKQLHIHQQILHYHYYYYNCNCNAHNNTKVGSLKLSWTSKSSRPQITSRAPPKYWEGVILETNLQRRCNVSRPQRFK